MKKVYNLGASSVSDDFVCQFCLADNAVTTES